MRILTVDDSRTMRDMLRMAGGGGFARPAPRPATSRSTPAPSPARAMAEKVASSFGAASRNDGWQEF